MLKYLFIVALAVLPLSEARGAIIYGLASGVNPVVVFSLAVIFNILTVPILFWILKKAKFRQLADRLFGQKMKARIDQNKDILNKYGTLGLLIFVALPLPITGAWTGTFIAEILKLDQKRAFIVIAMGVIIAAVLVLFGAGGTMFLLGKLI